MACRCRCLRGRTLGLVGESGCGKTTLLRMLMRILEPDSGVLRFRVHDDLQDITHVQGPEQRQIWQRMRMIFQDPDSSLNPRLPVRDIVAEPLTLSGTARGRRADRRARARPARRRRPQSRPHQPLPARVLRRPAPAHRPGARAGPGPQADPCRRADLGARRVGTGADPQPDAAHPGRARPGVRLRLSRPARRAPHERPHDRHVPRHGGRDRPHRGAVHAGAAPVHGGAAVSGARPRSGRQPRHAGGRDPRPGAPPARLFLPSALPL